MSGVSKLVLAAIERNNRLMSKEAGGFGKTLEEVKNAGSAAVRKIPEVWSWLKRVPHDFMEYLKPSKAAVTSLADIPHGRRIERVLSSDLGSDIEGVMDEIKALRGTGKIREIKQLEDHLDDLLALPPEYRDAPASWRWLNQINQATVDAANKASRSGVDEGFGKGLRWWQHTEVPYPRSRPIGVPWRNELGRLVGEDALKPMSLEEAVKEAVRTRARAKTWTRPDYAWGRHTIPEKEYGNWERISTRNGHDKFLSPGVAATGYEDHARNLLGLPRSIRKDPEMWELLDSAGDKGAYRAGKRYNEAFERGLRRGKAVGKAGTAVGTGVAVGTGGVAMKKLYDYLNKKK